MARELDRNRINDAITSLLIEIGKCYTSKKQITEDLLISLHALFPLHSVAALDLIDHKSVSMLTSPSGRKIYTCLGSMGTPYVIGYTGTICSCLAYRHNLNLNYENLWCKHLLALQLSIAMDIIKQVEVNEDFMMTMLGELMLHE